MAGRTANLTDLSENFVWLFRHLGKKYVWLYFDISVAPDESVPTQYKATQLVVALAVWAT